MKETLSQRLIAIPSASFPVMLLPIIWLYPDLDIVTPEPPMVPRITLFEMMLSSTSCKCIPIPLEFSIVFSSIVQLAEDPIPNPIKPLSKILLFEIVQKWIP